MKVLTAPSPKPIRLTLVALVAAISSGALMLTVSRSADAQIIRSHADASAEQFVQTEAAKVIGVLNNHGMGLTAKKQMFRQEIDHVADVPAITRFVLGKYARSVTGPQYAQFAAAFREYGYDVYESRLSQYRGQRLNVTGSQARSANDVIVASTIGGATTPVLWRLIRGPSGWRVVDVQVASVWLAITEQQDFVSTLDNAGGDVNVLIRQLRTQSARQG